MNKIEETEWLKRLLALIMENKDAMFSYYTSDDGVYLSYGPGREDNINLGFSHDSAAEAISYLLMSIGKKE